MEIEINRSKTVGHPELEWIDFGILMEAMYHFINILRLWNDVSQQKKGKCFSEKYLVLKITLGDSKKLFCWLLCLIL